MSCPGACHSCVCFQGADVNTRDNCGWLPLHEACNHGYTGKELGHCQFSLHQSGTDSFVSSFLMGNCFNFPIFTCSASFYLLITDVVFTCSASFYLLITDVVFTCSASFYLLITDVVRCLVDNGALVNDPGGSHCQGVTPLIDAATNGHLDVVQLLVQKGAGVSVKDTHVCTF